MKRLTSSLLVVAAAILVLSCGGATSVAMDQQDVRDSPVYLALGDSIPHGINYDLLPPPNDNVFNVTAYPWYLGQLIDIPVVDPACPGQTADGFNRTTGSDRGCMEIREDYPQAMHVTYSGSQLEFMEEYLAAHSRVRLVTLMIGADDVQLLADQCNWDPPCIIGQLPGVLGALYGNTAKILGTVRSLSPGSALVVQNYYSPFPPGTAYELLLQQLNSTLEMVATGFQAPTADVYGAFQKASEPFGGDPCKAGLLQRHPDQTCGFHPSPAGALLIAETIAPLVPAWTGKP